MKNRVLVCSLALFLGAAVAFSGSDKLTYTMTFTNLEGVSFNTSATTFEFHLGNDVLALGTPTTYSQHGEELMKTPAADLDLRLTKKWDMASVKLERAATDRTIFPSVKLALMGSVGDKEIHVTYQLKNVVVTRFKGFEGTEALTLNFAEVSVDN